jgi:alpha-tubulin suppressor-like RCC1 family protein
MKNIFIFFFGLSINFFYSQCWNEISVSSKSIGIKEDGTLWSWGITNYFPKKMENETNWKYSVQGQNHAVALKNDGTIWSWGGDNYYGQLGNSTTNQNQTFPQQIGIETNWTTVYASNTFTSYAIKNDSSLWAWGNNEFGAVGVGTIETFYTSPQQIFSTSKWVYFTANGKHALAINSNNELWGWGLNSDYQLGDGTNLTKLVPTRIGNESNWKKVETSSQFTLAIKTDGSLWAWGGNFYGNYGNNSTVSSYVPIRIGIDNDWTEIDCGEFHSVGLKEDGTLWCWGSNEYGQLGTGDFMQYLTPTKIENKYGNRFNKITAGYTNTAVLDENQNLFLSGCNFGGRIGNGNTVHQKTLFQIESSCILNLIESNLLTIEVNPNPTNGVILLSNITSPISVKITNQLGQIVFQQDIISNSINIDELNSGIYIMKIYSGKNEVSHRIIKN